MDHLTNIELFEIFKESKKSRFDKEPNFDLVVSSVCLKLNKPSSDKLLSEATCNYMFVAAILRIPLIKKIKYDSSARMG